MIIGSLFSPFCDQGFKGLDVLPNLIVFPNLPSNILSPSNGLNGLIKSFSTKVSPKGISKALFWDFLQIHLKYYYNYYYYYYNFLQ